MTSTPYEKPTRLTATPGALMGHAVTVWVESDEKGERVWLRPSLPTINPGAAASAKQGWVKLTKIQWETLRDTVDRYFEVAS